jgi:hypothetical protein
LVVVEAGLTAPRCIADRIVESRIKILNVAGSTESRMPGMGERAERFLCAVFRRIVHKRAE